MQQGGGQPATIHGFRAQNPRRAPRPARSASADLHPPPKFFPPSRRRVFSLSLGSQPSPGRPLTAHGVKGEVDRVEAFGQVGILSVLSQGHLQLAFGSG
jgi:hypothetical protein